MGRKTFVSYKYSDSDYANHYYRNKIMEFLKNEGSVYKGEDGFSDDLTGYKAETIKNRLKPMIHDSTVTIVLITPNVVDSNWVDWEVSYSLKDVTRDKEGRSRMNGIIGVIIPDRNGRYDYIISKDSCGNSTYDKKILPEIIENNRYNTTNSNYTSEGKCGKTHNRDYGSYCSLYKWDYFINNVDDLLEIAVKKSRSMANDYLISKELKVA